MTFPREGKFTSSHFLPQKMLWVVCLWPSGKDRKDRAGRWKIIAITICDVGALSACLREGSYDNRRSEKNKGGWKTQGRGKHTIKPLPKNGFWTTPPMIRFPPPFVFALLFSLEETSTDQANPTFWGLQNWFWRARSMVRFPPPKSHDTFCPPISRLPRRSSQKGFAEGFLEGVL